MVIEAKGITFSYGGRKVLKDVSFRLGDASLAALLGRNGAGKTTLLRILMGFLRPSAGSASADGKDISRISPRERARMIAYIPQSSPIIFPHTVRDIVLMGRASSLPVFSRPGKEDERRADEVMESLGILHLSSRPADAVSGGERQLALIARALVQDAKVLLLDEPTSSLDYANQLKVLETMAELRDRGYTVLFTTHSPDQALMDTDSVMLIDDCGHIGITDADTLISSDRLSALYGRKLCIRRIDTGRNERIACVPE